MDTTVSVSNDSRYKDTFVYAGDVSPEFGLYALPEAFAKASEDDRLHVVQSNEVGFLDKIAERHYGSGNETFWWAIAQLNAITDPELEMYAGMTLRIPGLSRVFAFSSRVGLGA